MPLHFIFGAVEKSAGAMEEFASVMEDSVMAVEEVNDSNMVNNNNVSPEQLMADFKLMFLKNPITALKDLNEKLVNDEQIEVSSCYQKLFNYLH